VQRVLLYLVPLGVMASGLLFPFSIGIVLYWFTSNLWTLAQQAYVIRFHPPSDDADVLDGPPHGRGGEDGARAPNRSGHAPPAARRPARPRNGPGRRRAKKR
jgi:membrane protein insertase Oxa1/YidC/SpoIIIJ